MRGTLVLVALVAALALAGSAQAHYLIDQDTPVGHVCLLNFEIIRDSLVAGDVDGVITGIYTNDC